MRTQVREWQAGTQVVTHPGRWHPEVASQVPRVPVCRENRIRRRCSAGPGAVAETQTSRENAVDPRS